MKLLLFKNFFLGSWCVVLSFLIASPVYAEFDLETGKRSNNLKGIDISTMQNGQIVAKLILEEMLEVAPTGVALSNPNHCCPVN